MYEYQKTIFLTFIIIKIYIYSMHNEYTEKDVMTIRIDHDTKEKASALFASMGLPLSTAVNIFLKQCVRESRIPFELNAGGAGDLTTAKSSASTTPKVSKKRAGRKPKSLFK